MATQEKNILMQKVDKDGNLICAYPITKAENVANLEAVIKENAEAGVSADAEQIKIGKDAEIIEGDVAIGFRSKATSMGSVAIGANASATGYVSTAVGLNTKASAYDSTAIGPNANASGEGATVIGGGSSSTGEKSVVVGYQTNNYGANEAICIGYQVTTAGEGTIAIGAKARAYGANSIALGANASASAPNTMQLGSSSLSALNCHVDLTVTSDERDKIILQDINKGLEFIKQLNPIQYVDNQRTSYIDEDNLSKAEQEKLHKYGLCEYDREAHAAGEKCGERKRVGLKAQGIQEALKAVYGTADYANLVNDNLHDLSDVPEDIESRLTVNYTGLIPFLIDAVQTLSARVEELENK